jgi:hypothetical protein
VATQETRFVLKQALERALADDSDGAHWQLATDPKDLSPLEKSAWLQLHNWSQDRQLRLQFPTHAEFSRRRLAELMNALKRLT